MRSCFNFGPVASNFNFFPNYPHPVIEASVVIVIDGGGREIHL